MAICEYVNCKGNYQPTKNWQRFCSRKCKDDFYYHQKKLAQEAEAEERREARLDRKPLSEILETLKPKPEPSFKRRAWG